MTKSEFLYNIPHAILAQVSVDINQMVGLSKTSPMVANLFATLPMKVEARFVSNLPKPKKKLNKLNKFVHAYLKHDDASKVILAFFYSSEKQLQVISNAVNKHPEYFSYLYMREALKLTRRMNTATHYRMMSNIIKHNAPTIPVEHHYRVATMANNQATNSTISSLFRFSNKLSTILDNEQYDIKYLGRSEMDILVDILSDYDPTTGPTVKLDDEFSYDEWSNEIFSTTDNSINIDESIQTDLGESLTTHLASMSRGTTSASIFEEHFKARKVKTGWFKQLTTKFNRDVYHITNTFKSEWSGLNITYKHKFKAPKHKYEDKALNIILSIDQSGSVSTDGLQKLLYLIEKKSKQITKLIILIHDTEIVQEVQLENFTDIAADSKFDILKSRIATGGTSHIQIVQRIDELVKDKTIEPDKTIFICFSDMYSDIPSCVSKYPVIKQLSTIWLSPINNPIPDSCGGTNITME